LFRDVDGILLEGMLIGDAVDEGDEDVKTGFEGGGVFAEAFDDERSTMKTVFCGTTRAERDRMMTKRMMRPRRINVSGGMVTPF